MYVESRPFCGVCKDNRADTYEQKNKDRKYWCATCYLILMKQREGKVQYIIKRENI